MLGATLEPKGGKRGHGCIGPMSLSCKPLTKASDIVISSRCLGVSGKVCERLLHAWLNPLKKNREISEVLKVNIPSKTDSPQVGLNPLTCSVFVKIFFADINMLRNLWLASLSSSLWLGVLHNLCRLIALLDWKKKQPQTEPTKASITTIRWSQEKLWSGPRYFRLQCIFFVQQWHFGALETVVMEYLVELWKKKKMHIFVPKLVIVIKYDVLLSTHKLDQLE